MLLLDWWVALDPHDLGDGPWVLWDVLLGRSTLNWWSRAGCCASVLRERAMATLRFSSPAPDQSSPAGTHRPEERDLQLVEEIDAFGTMLPSQSGLPNPRHLALSGSSLWTSYEHMFVGAQRGRWRPGQSDQPSGRALFVE